MRLPGGEELIRIWEQGRRQHPLDRALTMLEPFTGRTRVDLAHLPIGRRDRLLLDARRRIFGPRFDAVACCPECAAKLEFAVNTAEFDLPSGDSQEYTLATSTFRARFRLPNSFDLAAAMRCANADEGARAIAAACVVDPPEDLDTSTLAAEMARIDAAADIWLDLECASCGATWPVRFDIVSSFWAELAAHARRLLREVDVLARRYGWSESQILALSAMRRSFYLDQARA
jgi:HD-GYP domain-containing protein (c-di-GMP phosphodiesterase class II)